MNPDVVRMAFQEMPGPITIGRVRPVVAQRYGAESNWVWLSRETLAKQMRRHPDIPLSDYEDLDWLLRDGEIVGDRRADCLHVFPGVAPTGRETRMKACLKVIAGNRRILLVSLFRADSAAYRRLLRNAQK